MQTRIIQDEGPAIGSVPHEIPARPPAPDQPKRRTASRTSAYARRHPLAFFAGLTCALSWWPMVLYALGVWSQPIFGAGPFIAALVTLALTEGGRPGVRGLLKRMVQWRVGWRWYVVALSLPIVLTATAAALNVLLGATAPTSTGLGGWSDLPATFLIFLIIPAIGGTYEEPGFRGYALPQLQRDRSALNAAICVGVLWAVWHLPLIIAGDIHASDLILIVGVAIVLTWAYNGTGGSILLVMMMHAMNNTISGEFFAGFFKGPDSVRQSWLLAALWWGVALVLIATTGPEHLSRRRPKQTQGVVPTS